MSRTPAASRFWSSGSSAALTIPDEPTLFELKVKRLGLADSPERWPDSAALRSFVDALDTADGKGSGRVLRNLQNDPRDARGEANSGAGSGERAGEKEMSESLAMLIFGIGLLLVAMACTPKPSSRHVPPPPAAEPAKPRKITPGPNDRLVHRCTVSKQNQNSVDCVCRHVSEKIDSVTGAHSTECREDKR